MSLAAHSIASKRSAHGPRLPCLLGLLAVALSLQGCSLFCESSASDTRVEKLTEQVADAEARVAKLQNKLKEEQDEQSKAKLQGELTKAQEEANTLAEQLVTKLTKQVKDMKVAVAALQKQVDDEKDEDKKKQLEDKTSAEQLELAGIEQKLKALTENLQQAEVKVAKTDKQRESEQEDGESDTNDEALEAAKNENDTVASALVQHLVQHASGVSKRERVASAASMAAVVQREVKEDVKEEARQPDHADASPVHADVHSHRPSKDCHGGNCEIPEED